MLKTKQRINFGKNQSSSNIVSQFERGQITEFKSDKISFDSFSLLDNILPTAGDGEVRRGITTFKQVTDILSIYIHNQDEGKDLIAAIKTGADISKIVKISRENGTESDLITGIASEKEYSFASGYSYLYCANGETDIKTYDSIAGGITDLVLPAGKAKFIAHDGSRIWAFADGLLYFSEASEGDVIASFSSSGDSLGRGGIANTKITNATGLFALGPYILLTDSYDAELHRIPDFARNGVSTFEPNTPTIIKRFKGAGTRSRRGVVAIKDSFFIKGDGGTLHTIFTPQSSYTAITKNEKQMGNLNWDDCAIGRHYDKNLLFISGTDKTRNDTVVVFDYKKKIFSSYSNLFAKEWVNDSDNVYYLKTYDDKIEDCFGEEMYTDNGLSISYKIETAQTYGNNKKVYKIAKECLLGYEYKENGNITFEFLADNAINSTAIPDKIFVFDYVHSVADLGGSSSNFGLGLWGGAGIGTKKEGSDEDISFENILGIEYYRAKIRVSGSVKKPFAIREMGFMSTMTSTIIQKINYKQ